MNRQIASSSRLRRRGFWLRVLLLCLLLGPVIVFFLSNAWLQSSWGRHWVAGEISQRTGLPFQIGGAGWLPGGQIWIDDLRVLDPTAPSEESPLLQIRCLSIRPAWSAWVKGSRKISDVCITDPRLQLRAETLKSLLPAPSPPPADVTAVAPTPPAANQPAAPADPTTAAPPPTPTAPPPTPEAPSPTVWLKITGGHVIFTHDSQSQPLLEIQQISANLPIAGAPAAGEVQSGAITSLGQILAPIGQVALRWNYPLWETETTPFAIDTLHTEGKLQIARLPGLPFGMMIAQEPQSWSSADKTQQVEQIQSLHKLGGYLLGPQTWTGESLLQTQKIQAHLGGQSLNFFAAQSRIILQGGLLRCTDFRLLGDDYSLLGNGLCPLNGPCLGIARITAPRGVANDWENRWQQSFPEMKIALQPMFNEDRRAIDVVCGGTADQPWISFDQGKTMLDFFKVRSLWLQRRNTPTP
jgi:hypothetical protein